MKRIAEIKARKRPLTTRLLVVGWLVASPGRGMAPNSDYSALPDAEALSNECCPMLLFHPKMAFKSTLMTDVE